MARFRLNEERENLFALYQVIHPVVLSNLVGTEISDLEQEVSLGGKKVDICGWAEEIKQKVYVEVQLIPADNRHLEKVKEIINEIEQGIVIWEALSFVRREHLIEEVIEFAKGLKKPVDVLFVKINPDVVPILEQLAELYPLDVIPSLSRLSMVSEPLRRIREYKGREEQREGQLIRQKGIIEPYIHEPIVLSTRLVANLCVVEKIRQEIWYYPGAYRAKSRLDTNAITFGAGDGNTFEISIRDTYSRVKLRIASKNKNTFTQIKLKKTIFEDRIGYKLNFREKGSSSIVDSSVSSFERPRNEVVDEIVELFKRFVDIFTEYLYELHKFNKVEGAVMD